MNKTMLKLLTAAALLAGAPAVFAQTFVAPAAATGAVNGMAQTFTVTYNPVAGAEGFDFQLRSANANVTIVSATVAGSITGNALCLTPAALMGLGVNCNAATTTPGTALGAGVITVTYNAGATAGPVALTFIALGTTTSNGAGMDSPATFANGQVTLNLGPSAPSIGPLAATALPAGPINLPATGNVAVEITGAGTAVADVALACTIPATGASAFAVTSGGAQTITAPAVLGPGTPIGVSCVRGVADVIATLTCTQTTTPASVRPNLTAAITCPLGTVAANPGSSPAAPGPIGLIGGPGAPATGSVSFTNVGGTAAYSVTGCTASAGYTTSTIFPVVVGIAGTGAVSVSCVAPTAAGTQGPTGTLTCTTSAAGFNPTFNLTCSSQSASIPTLGNAGKALMVLLMLGFGLVGFQLYRRSA